MRLTSPWLILKLFYIAQRNSQRGFRLSRSLVCKSDRAVERMCRRGEYCVNDSIRQSRRSTAEEGLQTRAAVPPFFVRRLLAPHVFGLLLIISLFPLILYP